MKKTILLLVSSVYILMASAQDIYQQTATRFLELYNRQQSDSFYLLYSPQTKAVLSLDKNKQMFSQLHAQLGELKSIDKMRQDPQAARFKAAFDATPLTMILALDNENRVSGLHFIPLEEKRDTSNFNLVTDQGTLYGTLLLPQTDKKIPVVLIIAGSGPIDRNGNVATITKGSHTDAYKMLADSLAVYGIASLRYDKRGVGQSRAAITAESDLRFENMIRDAAGFIGRLKSDARFSKVIVLGHSEGSLVGMIAARDAQADAYISLAGAGRPADKIIEEQLTTQSPALAARATILLDSLRQKQEVHDTSPELSALFHSSIQSYLMSWLQYDPQVEIKKLGVPVLIVQGTTDMQVSVHDAELLKKAKPDATMHLINSMNHVLKMAPSDPQQNAATYNMPTLPVKTELVQVVRNFINDLK